MNKKHHIIVFIFLTCFLTSGCWSKSELDNRVIVSGIGIDKRENGLYEFSMQIILHREMKIQFQSGKRGEQKPTQVVSIQANNILEAARKFPLKTGRRAIWSHAKVIILSEELAKEGIHELLDVLKRDHEIKRRSYLIISNGKAKELLESSIYDLEIIQAYGIADMIDSYKVTGRTTAINFNDYSIKTSFGDKSGYLAGISKNKDLKNKELSTKSEQHTDKPEAHGEITLDGVYVLKADKVIGWLNTEQTKGLLFATNKLVSCDITVDLKGKENNVFIEILRNKTKIKSIIKNNEVSFEVAITPTCQVIGSTNNFDFLSNDNIEFVEQELNSTIKKIVLDSIKKTQILNADIIGFESTLRKNNYKFWKSQNTTWDKKYSTFKINVSVDSKLRRTGLIIKSD